MLIRLATVHDIAGIGAIYAYHVAHGLGTFETDPPPTGEMTTRFTAITDAGFPYLVAEDAGQITGFAYANHFRTRAAYRYTVEDSVYVAPAAIGRGIGKALLNALIERTTSLGWRQMLALIGDSANHASIGVHRACGFADVGTMSAVGHKAERWVDVVIMQRALGVGASSQPPL